MRKLLKLLLFAVYIILATAVLLEIAVRLWGYAEMYLYDPVYMPFPKSPEIPFVLKPNLKNVRAHGNIRVHTDSLGLRSLAPGQEYGEKGPEEFRIAIVGDSVTFGDGVATAETYPQVLEEFLNQRQSRCRVKVFNFAHSSYSVKEMTATLKHRMWEINPDLVIMAIYYPDFDLSRAPGVDQWGYNTFHRTSALIGDYPTIKLFFRKLHLSYLVRDISYRISKGDQSLTYGLLPDSYRYLLDFKKIADNHKIPYIILTLPDAGANGSQFSKVVHQMQIDNINYYDVSPIAKLFNIQQYRVSKFDFHPSAKVHRKIADLLAEEIMRLGLSGPCGRAAQP